MVTSAFVVLIASKKIAVALDTAHVLIFEHEVAM
jgi:hypothetical protein